jgi:tRNA nucleotidyltransferase (CCA-adding enzyme)
VTDLPPSTPTDAGQARERLAGARVPAEIRAVARRLHDAGHAAVLVGGAVRDALRGVPHDDWDLATSATPDEVLALFERTIPTGVQHGTVTVLQGRGERRTAVEVTTFRGEGAYRDGRRPETVEFLRELEQDLARRDFTINAFAWDPIAERFSDPFGGLADLRDGIVRAVGVPLDRFREDGLRTMRAVRFCATLGFRLDQATRAAIAGALDVFDLVSRERVRVELFKLLGAQVPSLGLTPMADTGLWSRVLGAPADGEARSAIEAVDAMAPDPVPRLARLLRSRRADAAGLSAALDALILSRAERRRIDAALGPGAQALAAAGDPGAVRRAAAGLGRDHLADAIAVLGLADARRAAIEAALVGAALTVGELALRGRDLVAEGIEPPGPRLGEILAALLEGVLEDPGTNVREQLLARARALARP